MGHCCCVFALANTQQHEDNNSFDPAFVTRCHIYSLYVETGPAWSCAVCIDYDLCNACYLKVGNSQHPHGLYNNPSPADCDEQNDETRLLQRLTKMLDLVAHASQCRAALCPYHGCCMMRGLFHHEIQCKTRAHAGCALCRRMWFLLQLHARACKESVCHVPCCRDLKELVRRSNSLTHREVLLWRNDVAKRC